MTSDLVVVFPALPGMADKVRLEDKTKTYYRDGWRLIKTTTIVNMRLDQITRDVIETLRFSGASSNANCALRTLRRMLHKAEEWTLIRHAPKLKLMKEYGRSLRLDDEAEKKLLMGAAAAIGGNAAFNFSRHHHLDARYGMRNERALPDAHREPGLGNPRDLRADSKTKKEGGAYR